jgi:predicted dehydrogenase
LIGTGGIGGGEHLPGWLRCADAELVACADVNPTHLQAALQACPTAKGYARWEDLLAHPGLTAVDICTPNRLHAPMALAALEHGLHVLCEKPLAVSVAEAEQLAAAAQARQLVLMTAQHFRFQPAARHLKQLVEAGLVGPIYYARGQWLRRRGVPPRPTFIAKALAGGGVALDLGVHLLDLALWLMGHPQPTSVTAVTSSALAHRTDLGGMWGAWDRSLFDVEDFAAGFIRFANGAALTLEVSWLAFRPEDEQIRLECLGTHGGIVWPDGTLCREQHTTPFTLRLDPPGPGTPYADEIAAFAHAVRTGGPSPVPVTQTLPVLRILDGLYTSARTGQAVDLSAR